MKTSAVFDTSRLIFFTFLDHDRKTVLVLVIEAFIMAYDLQ